MRTKDEILAAAAEDIRDEKNKPDAHLWLEYRKIEVLVDMRDMLELRFSQLIDRVAAIGKKD